MYECAARRGLTVGKDVSIVGVDNHRVFAETLEPQLTTVELPHYEMGYWAACKLISMIERKPVDSSSWPNTTAPMPPVGFADSCEDPLRADRKGIGSQLSFAI